MQIVRLISLPSFFRRRQLTCPRFFVLTARSSCCFHGRTSLVGRGDSWEELCTCSEVVQNEQREFAEELVGSEIVRAREPLAPPRLCSLLTNEGET
jgi:hypothetical protein